MKRSLKKKRSGIRCLLPAIGLVITTAPAAGSERILPENGRVVHGVITTEHPAAGALLWRNSDGSLGQSCSGTLIGCRHVMTAAHCVCDWDQAEDCDTPDPSRHVFYLQHGGLYDVAAVEFSPDYNFGVRSDIAVLTLAADVERITPMPINTSGRVSNGTSAIVVGFGTTSDSGRDASIKRTGAVTTSSCPDGVPNNAHVCWRFDEPSGPAGQYSNTCYGDSGSPLLVELGGGLVAAGVDSGIDGRCVKDGEAFDTSVYANRAFVSSVAGADLGASTCGTGLSHVGDPGVEVTSLVGTLGFSRGASRCRKSATKSTTKWISTVQKARQRCIGSVVSGAQQTVCPDGSVAAAIEKATAKLNKALAGTSCLADLVQSASFEGACEESKDRDALSTCLLAQAASSVEQMIASEHAVTEVSLPDAGARFCQNSVARAGLRYSSMSLKRADSCRKKADKRPDKGCDEATMSSITSELQTELRNRILASCTDEQVVALNVSGSFGASCAGAMAADQLAECQIVEHDEALATVTDLFGSAEYESHASFTVPAGTELLRVTLNGSEERGGIFHLHLAAGRPATEGDAGATLHSGYQAIEVATPDAGPWHALIKPAVAGSTRGPWQLTVTSFPP